MPLTNFIDGTTKIVALWLNQVDVFVNTLFNGATTPTQARTAISAASSGANSDITSLSGLTTPLSIAQGGTNAITASAARTQLGSGTVGDAVYVASTQIAAKTAIGVGGYVQDFRLTLTSGVPVTITDVTGATTVYCTPYKGNNIALYTGSTWVVRQSAEFSLALGTLVSGRPYDVFCYDNAGTPTLEFLAWTNSTTRATALVYQDGVLVKSGAATRRYLGSFYTTATTTTEDSLRRRLLFNYYNRARRPLRRQESAASWAYTNTTIRQTNANSLNQLEILNGVQEDEIQILATSQGSNASATLTPGTYIGENSTTTSMSDGVNSHNSCAVVGGFAVSSQRVEKIPPLGFTFYAWLEAVNTAVGTQTWYGTTSSGITGAWTS